MNILKSKEFDVPVISIGNITVGGTGKTPHVEYLINLLKDRFEVAALSRGYKRKTSGFQWVRTDSLVKEVGDEPLQVKRKFPDVTVSVCENRVKGVEQILSSEQVATPDVVLLDDAYQHRRITPGINILLIDYNRPVSEDLLLPAGSLRERPVQMRRASIILITKCPEEITPIMRRIMQKKVRLKPYQEMFFTTLEYEKIVPVFNARSLNESYVSGRIYDLLVITGIAHPILIYKHLKSVSKRMETISFADHHNYTEKEVQSIMQKFEAMGTGNKIIVTTEKDAVRFRDMENLPETFKQVLYLLPVKVRFLDEEGKLFNKKILGYVGENKSNRELHQRTNKNQS